jgi:hypothetical protein
VLDVPLTAFDGVLDAMADRTATAQCVAALAGHGPFQVINPGRRAAAKDEYRPAGVLEAVSTEDEFATCHGRSIVGGDPIVTLCV